MAALIMPTEDNPVSGYDMSYFRDTILGKKSSGDPELHLAEADTCPQASAIVKSLELLKYDSWLNWRHEFVVLEVHYNNQDYFIHLNRGWNGMGLWEYIPWSTWASVKAAEDGVAIYLPGEEEQRERDGVRRVYRLNFDGENVTLGDIALVQHTIHTHSAPYSLFGMNCWGASRILTSAVLQVCRPFIRSFGDKHGPTTFDAISLALRSDPWMLFNLFETSLFHLNNRKAAKLLLFF
jgi:hypothetical protein